MPVQGVQEFQTIPINITGPSYRDRSRPLSSQETRNLYHEVVESGKDKYVIKSFPGQKMFGTTTAGADLGQHRMNEIDYRVVDQRLWEVDSLGNHTARGTIIPTERCIFADDGVDMFFTTGNVVHQYDSDTQTLSVVADVDIQGAKSVTFINNQFAYTFDRLTVFSDVGNGASASSLNAIDEESTPDDMVRDYEFDQLLWRFGTRSVLTWWNTGVGTPPFERIDGQAINIGLAAKHSVANTPNFIYWLGSNRQVYQARAGQEQIITTAAIAGEFKRYTTVSDAFAEVFTLDNKYVYLLKFPSEGKTWLLFEELGKDGWIELTTGTGEAFNAGSIVEAYDKILVGDESNGNLYELDFNTYDIGGDTWQRRRVISSINGDLLGLKGRRVEMSRLELIVETGTGLLTGQGEDPKLMIEASYDGGRSWAFGGWLRIGRLGETNVRAEWFNMKSFYDMMIRITTSDPVAFNLYSGAVDLRLSGE